MNFYPQANFQNQIQSGMLIDQISQAFKEVNKIVEDYFITINKINSGGNYNNNYKGSNRQNSSSYQNENTSKTSNSKKQKSSSTSKKASIPQEIKSSIPEPPKAPLSPYFAFYKQKKGLIKEQYPDMSITQIASAAAKVWKTLSEDQKKPYMEQYYVEKKNFEDRMREYVKKYPNYKELLKNQEKKKSNQFQANSEEPEQ